MVKCWDCCIALACGLSLVVVTTTTRAEQSSVLPLFISDTITADSAAARAAQRLSETQTVDIELKTQSLHAVNAAISLTPGIVLAPLTQWRHTIPALDVLRLPFFYADLSAIHDTIDGELGTRLAHASQAQGWTLLAVWDAGMTNFSGNQRYNRLPNLAGMQFVLWEHDPQQEAELRALDVWTRVIPKDGIQRNARECLVNSRSTTPAQMWREQLHRVHLDITLTQDRYEGYALAIPTTVWKTLTQGQRDSLTTHLVEVTHWERIQAAAEQQQALVNLHKAGMTLHELDATQRREFARRMPAWSQFLDKLDSKSANELLTAASTTTATGGSGGTREKPLTKPLPTTQTTE